MSSDSEKTKKSSGHNALLAAIVVSVVIGALLGHFAPHTAVRLKFLGDLFLRALFMLVVPLVMASMISGVTHLGDVRKLGPLGSRTVVYYLLTTTVSVIIGIILVNIIRPGSGIERKEDVLPDAPYLIQARPIRGGSSVALIGDERLLGADYGKGYVVLLNDQEFKGHIDPDAIATDTELPVIYFTDASGKKIEPRLYGKGIEVRLRERRFSFMDVIVGLVPRNLVGAMAEDKILPLIVFSLLLGAILTTMGEPARPVIDFVASFNAAILKFIGLVMVFAPIGILGLVAARLGQAELSLPGGFLGELSRLARYSGTVILGLLIHAFIVLPLVLRFLGKRPALPYARNMLTALATAFSTASSSATLPMTIQGVSERNRVSSRTSSFVLPLGATINMDGTALYEAVAAIFIAQVYNIDLTFGDQVVIVLTATLAAIGAAGIPEAGLVTMVLVLKAAGLPTEGIAVILAIDWFLDRCRTTVNVWGDAVGAAVVDRMEEGKIETTDEHR